MTLTPSKRWIAVLWIGLFLCLQGLSSAHAASYGDETHEHDGVICVVGAAQLCETVILPSPPVLYAPENTPIEVYRAAFTSALYLPSAARAPPGRSPPHSIH